MRENYVRYSRPALGALLIFLSAVAVVAQLTLSENAPDSPAKPDTLATALKLVVANQERYFLGEAPIVRIAITNTGRSPQSVKEAEYQKFSLDVTGLFQNDTGPDRKTLTYDGSWDRPKLPTTLPGDTHEWLAPAKREPKFVKLAPGESTTLELDLSKTFRSDLGVGKYKMIVTSEDGHKVVKEFEVYFDDEKSVPILAKMLESDDSSQRSLAVFYLAKFNRAKLLALLETLVKSGTESQRDFASGMLAQTKAGWFDPLKLRVAIKDRYFLGEIPILAISIHNGSSKVQTVKEAKYQRFALELSGVFENDSKPATKTCIYDGTQHTQKQSQQKPKVVKLSELESTTLSLNLSECFHSRLRPGKYELSVKSADEQQQAFKDQKVVKKFEVYFNQEKSVPGLAQVLNADDAAEREWAVSSLAQFSRPKLVALLAELVKTGNEKQRDFASGILAEIKAGRYGPDPALSKTKNGGE